MWIIRAFFTLTHLLLGLFCIFFILQHLNPQQQVKLKRWYANRILFLFNTKPQLHGQWPQQAGIVVLNHISWIDIFVVNAFAPCIFIAKAEIAKWPLIGTLVARSGTIFIERKRRQAVVQAIADAGQYIKKGAQVAIFPEGTTTDGHQVKPFYANLFQTAVNINCPVFSVALRYTDSKGKHSTTVAFVNNQSLLANALMLWKSKEPFTATLIPCHTLQDPQTTRQQYAQMTHQAITQALNNL